MLTTPFTPYASFAGGVLIGLSAVLLLAVSGRIAGISGIVRRVLFPAPEARPLDAAAFLVGLVVAPLLWQLGTNAAVVQTVSDDAKRMGLAGLLVGLGAALANGCTSGHGVCGLARLSTRSIVATVTFMAVAATTVYVSRHVLGG